MTTIFRKRYIDYSLGFPVTILNAPMVKVRGQWALRVNYNDYQEAVLSLLAFKPTKLTGSEIQFIRKHFEMTVRDYADRFAIRHPAVIKWEKQRDKATRMTWSTEKDIRLFIVNELSKKSSELAKLYRSLECEAAEPEKAIQIDAKNIAA